VPLRAPRAHAGPELVGSSLALRRAEHAIAAAAGSRATVLVQGETGSGKEIAARRIHAQSTRHAEPFVAVNCAAFADSLLASELFGHRRGAFTGADRDRVGLFERAQGGTLFLDEIGETSAPLQASLLRVLQEREVLPVGGERPRPVDVRVVAATHRDLSQEIAAGRFREDLYYRLAVLRIELPPLRERPGDVRVLAAHFLEKLGERSGTPGCQLSPRALRLLERHAWPGNVRELENEMQRVLALAVPGELITARRLSPSLRDEAPERTARSAEHTPACHLDADENLQQALERIEAELIRGALDAHDGRKARTARRLGVTREGLYKKLKRLGIA
jgi:transcriptional regulator with PAS, ATPase and Fis domain